MSQQKVTTASSSSASLYFSFRFFVCQKLGGSLFFFQALTHVQLQMEASFWRKIHFRAVSHFLRFLKRNSYRFPPNFFSYIVSRLPCVAHLTVDSTYSSPIISLPCSPLPKRWRCEEMRHQSCLLSLLLPTCWDIKGKSGIEIRQLLFQMTNKEIPYYTLVLKKNVKWLF